MGRGRAGWVLSAALAAAGLCRFAAGQRTEPASGSSENVCLLPLEPFEVQVATAGLRVGTSMTLQPPRRPLVIGMLPSTSSIIVGEVAKLAVEGLLGYSPVELRLVGADEAAGAVAEGRVHLMLDLWPARSLPDATAFQAFASSEGVLNLGPLGITMRTGLYMSRVLTARLRQAIVDTAVADVAAGRSIGNYSIQALASMDISTLQWSELVDILATFRVPSNLLPSAVSDRVFVLVDDPALPGLWGSSMSRVCVTRPNAAAFPPSRRLILRPFADIGIQLECALVRGGEEGLRAELRGLFNLQGRFDAMVVLPDDPSPLASDVRYDFRRVALPRYHPACYSAGTCDWPREVTHKVAWAGLLDYFPREIMLTFRVSGRWRAWGCLMLRHSPKPPSPSLRISRRGCKYPTTPIAGPSTCWGLCWRLRQTVWQLLRKPPRRQRQAPPPPAGWEPSMACGAMWQRRCWNLAPLVMAAAT